MFATKGKAPKTVSVPFTATGVVERCDLCDRAPYHTNRYIAAEQSEYFLDVCLRLTDGSAVYFKTVVASRTVTAVPGAAVVIYSLTREGVQWVYEDRGDVGAVATVGSPNTNKLVPLVNVGDTLKVTGRVKSDTVSKKGNRYKVLTHVHREV